LNSPCHRSVKPGLLAVYLAPHRYLSGPTLSPPVCIRRRLRPKDAWPTCIGQGATGLVPFRSFHRHTSWRTPAASPHRSGCARAAPAFG